MDRLYELVNKAKKNDEAIEQVIEIFTPKIKKTLLQTDIQNREDLEQELRIKLMSLIRTYDLNEVMGFWEFHEMVQKKVS